MQGRGGDIVRVVRDEGRVCSGGGRAVSASVGERESGEERSEPGEKVRGGCALVSDEGSV